MDSRTPDDCAPSRQASCCPSAKPAPAGCCPPRTAPTPGCRPPQQTTFPERPGYRKVPFVSGAIALPDGELLPCVTSTLTWRDRLGHWAMRWGMGRSRYPISPGLYALGTPDQQSPVAVTANYKMTFDLLRRALAGHDLWLLVLETRGINVWCAAGKGTFGTEELIRRVRASRVTEIVAHRTLILPQLGAPGVAAHEVRRQTGFRVEYGPVRATDLPAFLATGRVAPEMRRVSFTLGERLVLTPVELTGMGKVTAWTLPLLFLAGGLGPEGYSLAALWERGSAASLAYLAALLTGAVGVPLLLPWLPGRAFAFKGWLLGVGTAGLILALTDGRMGGWNSLALLCAGPAFASYVAMNFTGSTPFTSPSGVEREMRRSLPLQGGALVAAALFWLWAPFAGA